MTDESAVTLLRDVDALRKRTRSDRWGYWLPLLLLGLLIVAAPLAYRQLAFPSVPAGASYGSINISPGPVWHIPGTNLTLMPLRLFAGPSVLVRDPTVVAVYWLCVVVVGMAATVVWYRWRGRRVGVETSTRTFVVVGVAGLLFLLGIIPLIIDATVLSFLGYYTSQTFWISIVVFVFSAGGTTLVLRGPHADRRPAWQVVVGVIGIVVALSSASVVLIFASLQGYAPLLVIAMALLALATVERSRFCTVVTILFTLAAVLVNLYDIENVAYYLHLPHAGDAQFVALARVLLPSTVLIVGGIIGAIGARRTSR